MSVTLRVNGIDHQVDAPPETSLLEVLRDDLGITGPKYGCGEGQCAACSVMIGTDLVHSCITPLSAVEANPVTTIEGLQSNGKLNAVQQAFIDEQAMQCGYCVAGMIMAATHFLSQNPNPTEQQIRDGMAPNICRCGGYPNMIKAVQRAAKSLGGAK